MAKKNLRKHDKQLNLLIAKLKKSNPKGKEDKEKAMKEVVKALEDLKRNGKGKMTFTRVGEEALDLALSSFLDKVVKPTITYVGDKLTDLGIWVAGKIEQFIKWVGN